MAINRQWWVGYYNGPLNNEPSSQIEEEERALDRQALREAGYMKYADSGEVYDINELQRMFGLSEGK